MEHRVLAETSFGLLKLLTGLRFIPDQDLTKRSRLLRIEAALQDLTLAGGDSQQPQPEVEQQEWQQH